MVKSVVYDHAYTLDDNHKFLKELGQLGFKIDEMIVEHPGKAICRFLKFQDSKKAQKQYLEFVSVKGAQREKHNHAGLSFRYTKGLEKYYDLLKKKDGLTPIYIHKNYNWKENDSDQLPGWNFLTFKNAPTRSIYPWFTEYEPHNLSLKTTTNPVHPNGALKIVGVELSVTQKVHCFFEKILNSKFKKEITLSDGVKLIFKSSSKNKCDRVLIQVGKLRVFEKFIGRSKLEIQETETGFLIRNPNPSPRMYDLEVLE